MVTIGYQNRAIDPSACISDAWELVKRRLGLYIGCSLVMLLIFVLTSLLPLAQAIVTGPLIGGFSYLVLRDLRGEDVQFSQLFYGFGKFGKLVLIGLIQAFPAIVYEFIQIGMNIRDSFTLEDHLDPSVIQVSEPMKTEWIVIFVMMMIGYFIFSLIWQYVLMFAIPLFVEHDLPVTETIKLSFAAVFKNFGGMFVLGLMGALVLLLGLIALGVGLIVALPVVWAANVVAYKQVFPVHGETLFSGVGSSRGSMLNLDAD